MSAGTGAGMSALAVAFPSVVRTNDWWRARHPDLVRSAEERTLAKLWTAEGGSPGSAAFDAAMQAYLGDPFRGAVERRVLGPGESALGLELTAARRALRAARLAPRDLDLAIVSSFRANQVGVGNASFLARELELECGAWNLETACSGATVAFHTACDLVRAGAYRRILVVVSCCYSRDADERDTLSWFLGDAAGAFVVSAVEPGDGLLGRHTVHTGATCDAFAYALELDAAGQPTVRMRAGEGGGRILRETSAAYLRVCVERALADACVALDAIDFFVCNTPVAWFATFATQVLGIDPARTISTYARYGNVGPALMPVNLYEAAASGRIRPGDRVVLYSVGSVSTASAAVMRWGKVPLGERPS